MGYPVLEPDDAAQEGLDNLDNGPTWIAGAPLLRAAMKEIWTTEVPSFQSEHVRFPALKCYPKPRQKRIHRFTSTRAAGLSSRAP